MPFISWSLNIRCYTICRKILDYHFIHLSYIWYTWIKMYIKHLFTLFKGRTPFEVVLLLLTHWISYSWGNKDWSTPSYTKRLFNFAVQDREKQGILFLIIPWFPVIPCVLKKKEQHTWDFFFNVFLLDTSIRNKLKKCILLVTGDSV